jgi:hypothetical protein
MKFLFLIKQSVYIVFSFCIFNSLLLKGQNRNNFEGLINYSSDLNLDDIIPDTWNISMDSLKNELSENTDLISSYSTLYISGNRVKLKISDNDSYFNVLNKQFHCVDSACSLSGSLSNKDIQIIEDTILYVIRGITCKKVEIIHPLQRDVYYYNPSFLKVDTSNYSAYKIGDPFFQFICRTGHLPIKMEIGKVYTFTLDNFQEIAVDSNEFILPNEYYNALIESQTHLEKPNKNYTIGQEKEFLVAFLNACTTAKNLSSFISSEDIQKKNHLLLVDPIGYNDILNIEPVSSNTFLVKMKVRDLIWGDQIKTYLFTLTSHEGYLSLKLRIQHIPAPEADIYLGNEMNVAFWGEPK